MDKPIIVDEIETISMMKKCYRMLLMNVKTLRNPVSMLKMNQIIPY